MYRPTKWVIVRVDNPVHGTYFKVLGMWNPMSDMPWRMNSGITKIFDRGNYYEVHGNSGSVYECFKGSEKVPEYMQTLVGGIESRGGKIVSIQECIEYLNYLHNEKEKENNGRN